MRGFLAGLLCLLALALPAAAQDDAPLVLAAASLQESLTAAASSWAGAGHARPTLSFAGTSALARQIAAGAPADLFISADETWMDHVEARGLIRPDTRTDFLSNRLVLIAPEHSNIRLSEEGRVSLRRALGKGRLAIADVNAVPAGKYAKAALQSLGAWNAVEGRLATAENVRAAMALVERGQAPLGIVYATDARASDEVRVVGLFPERTHPPIVYPLALLKTADSDDAEGFRRFLLSAEGKAIFARHGFSPR